MRLPSLFIPHGGGPCFFMNEGAAPDPMWQPMEAYLKTIVAGLPERPKAILIISGHWEEAAFTVHDGKQPDLLFDYHNFPPHTYRLRWDAPGAPDVAARAASLIAAAGFATGSNGVRGWDHGVFIPMMVAVPDADIPVTQLSLRRDLDPAAHIAVGRALAPLRDEGVLIVGSGMSFHNMRAFGTQATQPSEAFDAGLTAAVTDPDPAQRDARLADWRSLPFAAFAHPREEHLIPLMVAAGAGADDRGVHDHNSEVIGWSVSGYRFG